MLWCSGLQSRLCFAACPAVSLSDQQVVVLIFSYKDIFSYNDYSRIFLGLPGGVQTVELRLSGFVFDSKPYQSLGVKL